LFGIFKKPKPDGLVALSAKELLKPYGHLIGQIHQQVAVPETHWKAVYLQFIDNFAKQVQLLPASESHHHSSAGGLLTHSLEVGLNALKFRKSKMLPLGGTAEVIEEQKELWSYAIFTAAMLHDIGKPLTDQRISIQDGKIEKMWQPLTETLLEGTVYKISFRRRRKYRSHENIALLLATKIVPIAGMNWITSNSEVLDDWTFCLTGRKSEANILGELVSHADQTSTAQNLTGTSNIPLPSAKGVPLHQRLLTSLIYLLDDGVALPLNRAGAAGWVYDDKLWLVSKRILDQIREHMTEEGQTGIPSDNSRLMDELMQNGIILPANEDRAVWKMTVQVDSWKNNFTCLCFPLVKIWSKQTAWPAQPDNIKVTVVETNKTATEETSKNVATGQNEAQPKKVISTPTKKEPESVKEQSKNLELDALLPLPPGITLEDNQAKSSTQDKPINNEAEKTPKNNQTAQLFINWISNGIADGSLAINVQNALVHTVGENKDLILVSPLIFRKYAQNHDLDYKQIQRSFQTLNLHTFTKDSKNIWKFETLSTRKNKKPKILNAMLIENAEEKLNIRLPPGNIHIKRK